MRVLIVGSGIAGLTAALHLAGRAEVTVLTKSGAQVSNTAFAQGGIAAVTTPEDAVAAHVRDTLAAGATWCDPGAVEVLCSQGPQRIAGLIGAGVAFDRDDDGALALGLEAAHSRARVLHAGGDATGAAIARGLLGACADAGVQIREHTVVTDLFLEGGRVRGARVIDQTATQQDRAQQDRAQQDQAAAQQELAADAVILATGGAGQLFGATSNPEVATGDGVALAARAGAGLADLEFYQFHPTTLTSGNFLISEAVRGEGALLLDHAGVRFMPEVDPRAELAPRDVVARAVAARMAATDAPVFLDATALGGQFLARRFPSIDAAVRAAGWDWSRDPVPITPAAHYWMGGVATDLWGRTTVPGLLAAGEVACTGVHGANRLASNSLLEGAVFGHRAALAITGDAWPSRCSAGTGQAASRAPWRDSRGPARTDLLYADDLPAAPAASARRPWRRADLQELMWHSAGLIREESTLARAESELASWAAGTTGTPAGHDDTVAGYEELVTGHEDRNLLLVARLLTHAARARRTSLGAHFRSDAAAPDRERGGAPASLSTGPAIAPTSAAHSPGEASATELSATGASLAVGTSAGVDTLEFH